MKNTIHINFAIFLIIANIIYSSASASTDISTLVLKSIPVGVAYAVWSGLGVVIITAIAWLLHGQKLDAWGFVGMGLIIAAFLLARSPSWKSLRRPTPW
ncbi:TPA: hypothetical protein L9000_005778 [Klebsiella pneumoniae]|nr:hypothetical protein [Klebsiella pneumoniae]HBR5948510.1 hypothetical protein [Klebsiella pneumoniae]